MTYQESAQNGRNITLLPSLLICVSFLVAMLAIPAIGDAGSSQVIVVTGVVPPKEITTIILEFPLNGVTVVMVSGVKWVIIDPKEVDGTVEVSGNDAIITPDGGQIRTITFHLDPLEQPPGTIQGPLLGIDIVTRPLSLEIPDVGTVKPYFELSLGDVPTSGQVIITLIPEDLVPGTTATGTKISSVAYLVEVNADEVAGAVTGVDLVFPASNEWVAGQGSNQVTILVKDESGNFQAIPTSKDTPSVSQTFFSAHYSGGSGIFALVSLQPFQPSGGGGGGEAPSGLPLPPAAPEGPPAPLPAPQGPEPPVIEPEILPQPVPKSPPELSPLQQITDTFATYLTSEKGIIQQMQDAAHVSDISSKSFSPLAGVLSAEARAAGALVTGVALTAIGAAYASITTTGGLSFAGGAVASAVSKFWHKILTALLTLVRKWVGFELMNVVGTKTVRLRRAMLVVRESLKGGISLHEFLVISLSVMVYISAFVIAGRLIVNWVDVILFLFMAAVAVLGGEYLIAIFAKQCNCDSELQIWRIGTFMIIINAAIFGMVFGKPSRTMVGSAHILTPRERASLMLLGPMMNVVFAMLSLLLIQFGGILATAGAIGVSVNLLLAMWQLFPIFPMKGKVVYDWNKIVWALFYFPLLGLYVAVYLLP
ncbi:MAG: hypothetical protein RQ758_05315 [Methanomicrobiaceae archaeon]|nr:hypothetical protein [Methanomicrobiaceae archaeon]